MKIAHVTFVFVLLELFSFSNSFKTSRSRAAANESEYWIPQMEKSPQQTKTADETPPPSKVLATEGGAGGIRRGVKGEAEGFCTHTTVTAMNNVANLLMSPRGNNTLASAIPRVIHVTFTSIETLPQCVADTFEKINPGFKVRKWGDKEII